MVRGGNFETSALAAAVVGVAFDALDALDAFGALDANSVDGAT